MFEISGSKWVRCHTVNISNELNGPKIITFLQEQVFDLGSDILRQYGDACQVEFDEAQSFELLDENNQPTGQTMTHGDLYQALRSLYYKTAIA